MNLKTIFQVSAVFFMTANLSAQLNPSSMEGLNQNIAAVGGGQLPKPVILALLTSTIRY